MKKDIERLVEVVRKSPIVKKFYELKEKGLCPRLLVHQVEGKVTIDYARLQLPGIDLYFHKSGKEEVTVEESENMKGEKIKIWSIPFDGWETNDYYKSDSSN